VVRLPIGRWKGAHSANTAGDPAGHDVFITVPDTSDVPRTKVEFHDENGDFAGVNSIVRSFKDLELEEHRREPLGAHRDDPRAVGFVAVDAPVIQSSAYQGIEAKQYEYRRNGKSGTIIEGREFLSSVELGYSAAEQAASPIGQRLLVLPVSPVSIGGRLSLFSQAFQVNNLEYLRLTYIPSVPTSKGGAIVMYYHGDDSIPLSDIGEVALRRASQHDSFVDSPVWTGCSINIDPVKALRKYFDEETNTVRFSVQGLIAVVTGTAISADATGVTPLGSVFIDYAYRFEDPAIDQGIQTNKTGLCNLAPQTGACVQYDPAIARFLGTPLSSTASFPVCTGFEGIEIGEWSDYIYLALTQFVTVTWTDTWQSYPTLPDLNSANVSGKAFFMRMVPIQNTGSTEYYVMFFTDLSSAMSWSFSPGALITDMPVAPGQLVHGLTLVPSVSLSSLKILAWKIGEQ
jgi:hypothetical protein